MAIERAYSAKVSLKLNAGTNGTGGALTKTVNLPKVQSKADAGKIMTVISALVPLLEFPPDRIFRTEVSVIEA